jgi:hypothetical protein
MQGPQVGQCPTGILGLDEITAGGVPADAQRWFAGVQAAARHAMTWAGGAVLFAPGIEAIE